MFCFDSGRKPTDAPLSQGALSVGYLPKQGHISLVHWRSQCERKRILLANAAFSRKVILKHICPFWSIWWYSALLNVHAHGKSLLLHCLEDSALTSAILSNETFGSQACQRQSISNFAMRKFLSAWLKRNFFLCNLCTVSKFAYRRCRNLSRIALANYFKGKSFEGCNSGRFPCYGVHRSFIKAIRDLFRHPLCLLLLASFKIKVVYYLVFCHLISGTCWFLQHCIRNQYGTRCTNSRLLIRLISWHTMFFCSYPILVLYHEWKSWKVITVFDRDDNELFKAH